MWDGLVLLSLEIIQVKEPARVPRYSRAITAHKLSFGGSFGDYIERKDFLLIPATCIWGHYVYDTTAQCMGLQVLGCCTRSLLLFCRLGLFNLLLLWFLRS